ncbi:ATP-binding protein [Knoellia locipacati]|uniref:AAA family ATPase n=1 Tax=Knoellia locipacati TaxID=882824 RepID=UPI00384DF228
MQIPDPALVVLVGAAGSGKSTWAAAHYRPTEVVSSDALRAAVGSGTADLDASDEAFQILDQVVAGRCRRGLTVVVDTLGLDADRRAGWAALARKAGLPVVAVVFDTPAATCRARNAARDRPVPASVLGLQLHRMRDIQRELEAEGWDVHVVDSETSVAAAPTAPVATGPVATRPIAARPVAVARGRHTGQCPWRHREPTVHG